MESIDDLHDEYVGKVAEIISNLGAIRGQFGNSEVYLFEVNHGRARPVSTFINEEIGDGRLIVSSQTLRDMIIDYVKSGMGQAEVDTWLEQEVDYDTNPPSGCDYHSWERQSRDRYRKDLLTLKDIRGRPKISVKNISRYASGWRF